VKEVAMQVTAPLLLVLTALIMVMLRFRHKGDGLTVFEFLLCGTWGFLLASSTLAPTIRTVLDTLVNAVQR